MGEPATSVADPLPPDRPNGWAVSRRPAVTLVVNSRTFGAVGSTALFGGACTCVRPRVTLSYMKTTLTIRLDAELEKELNQACEESGRTRSDLARDALRRQLSLLRFERLRRKVLPFAEANGYLTDEDVFRRVS